MINVQEYSKRDPIIFWNVIYQRNKNFTIPGRMLSGNESHVKPQTIVDAVMSFCYIHMYSSIISIITLFIESNNDNNSFQHGLMS